MAENKEIYTLTVPEARSSTSVLLIRAGKAVLSADRCSRGGPIPFLFQLQRLLAFLGLWPYYSSFQGQHLQISLCSVIMAPSPLHVCQISLCLSLIRTLVRALKAIIIR